MSESQVQPDAPFGVSTVPFAEPLWYSRGSSPYYNASHRALRAVVRKYVDEDLRPFAEEWEKEGEIPAKAYKRHAEMGFFVTKSPGNMYSGGVKLPGGIGPDEWDGFHSLIVNDELTRVGYYGVISRYLSPLKHAAGDIDCQFMGEADSILTEVGLGGGSAIGCPPIFNFGNEEQKRRFLPKVSTGDISFCLGITEPDAGSDVSNIKTTAVRDGDVYVVNGSKKWITNGIWAQYCTAAVRTGGPGREGISLLIVPLESRGVSRRQMDNSGVRASGSTYIEFDDVHVPTHNLIGQENGGFPYIMSNFNPERLGMACASLRLSRVCAEDAYAHSLTRETFGQTLISHGVIRAKLANFGALIEPAFAFMEQLVWLIEQSRTHPERAASIGGMTALLKIVSTRTLEKCVREAQQIMGGLGYSKGGKGGRIEQISRDVRMFVVGGGSDEIMTELALKQEVTDLRRYKVAGAKSKM